MSKHGGARVGAGRPAGSTRKEATKPIRVPVSRVDEVKELIQFGKLTAEPLKQAIPLYGCSVRAGFPSPADDYIEDYLDLNEYLVQHPAATFFVRAKGESMINASIRSGDILVVDRSIEPTHGKVVVAAVANELTVKRLYLKDGVMKLLPENPEFREIIIKEEIDTVIWGVVTNVIHKVD